MPHYFDFSVFDNLNEIEIHNLAGWINPITIEYAYGDHAVKSTLFWRVKGTAHTFTIPVRQFNKMSEGNPEEHFREALLVFHKDLKDWYMEGLPEKWMREYIYMFKNYITF